MTDRPALAEALGKAVDDWLRTMPGTDVPEVLFERVLAEHEAAEHERAERVFQAVVYAFEGKPVPDDLVDHGMVRRGRKHFEAAEARCAQLEQALSHAQGDLDYCRGEHASIDAILEDRDEGTTYLKVEALLTEHERLRAAVELVELEAARAEALTNASNKGGQHVGRHPQMERSMAVTLLKVCRAALAPSQEAP